MSGWRLSSALAIAVSVIMVFGALGLAGVVQLPAGHSSTPAAAAAATPSSSLPATPFTSTNSAVGPSTLAPGASATLGKDALALSQQDNIPNKYVYIPNANSATKPVSETNGTVQPLYSYAPAPMGVADYGITNTTGTPVPSLTTTTSVAGTFTTNDSEGVQPFYMDSGVPDGYSIQLNSVLVNVNLQGNTSTDGIANQFWTQNVVLYSAQLHQLQFLDNVWSFSPGFSPNTFASYGPNGTFVYPEYYYATGPLINISYPFSVGLYLNSTVINGDDAVFFNYTLSNQNMSISGSYDYVIFDSSGTSSPGQATFQADGYNYNPLGLTNDFEIIIGGPGGGSTTDLMYSDATMTLSYWNSTLGAYQAVPAAYNYGGETGETSNGANVWYSGTTASLTTGPSFLNGLWNASGTPEGNPGYGLLHLNITPSNAFLFSLPENLNINTTNGTSPYIQWAPTIGPSLPDAGWLSGVIPLAPGSYLFGVLLSDYTPYTTEINITSGGEWLTVNLTFNQEMGSYTPLYAWNNSQLAYISYTGNGTAENPYLLFNDSADLLGLFAMFNDYIFPEFAGALFIGITAYVVDSSPGYYVPFPDWLLGYSNYYSLPDENYLQTWIAFSTNFIIDGATFAGWFFYENSWADPANLMIFNSENVLVENSLFGVSATGLFIYNGNAGIPGGGVTVWGNVFQNDDSFTYGCSYFLCSIETQYLGIQLGASGDLVYNNYFDTEYTAWTPTFDWWTIQVVYPVESYVDIWNVTEQNASNILTAPGFPEIPLNGSIVGTSYQGGNYWWDYGYYPNSYGVLPYNGAGLITNGGDYVPLVPYTLYPVNVSVTGAPAGLLWFGSVYDDSNGYLMYLNNGTGSQNYTVWLPIGTYDLQGSVGTYSTPLSQFFVSGGTNVTISFPALYTVTFTASGDQNTSATWEVDVYGNDSYSENVTQGNASMTFLLPTGGYTWYAYVYSSSIAVVPATGMFNVTNATIAVAIAFEPVYTVTFTPTNLPGDIWWWVFFGPDIGTGFTVGAYNLSSGYSNGTYTVEYASENPYFTPYQGDSGTLYANLTFTVDGSNLTVIAPFTQQFLIWFTQTGLPSFDTWNVTINGSLAGTSEENFSTITVWATNGTYAFVIATNDPDFVPSPLFGNVVIAGSNQTVNVTFTSVVGFIVVFQESGLPNNTAWIVQFNGTVHTSTGTSITISVSGVGSYDFAVVSTNSSWVATPASGMVDVSEAVTIMTISFASPSPTDQVYFTASGIWPGTLWGVTLANQTYYSLQSTLWFTVSPGTYNYTVLEPSGYDATPANGTVTVSSASLSLGVTFSLIVYSVTFEETGLPVFTLWAVQVGAVLYGSFGNSITFELAPGSYSYLIGWISGWTPDSPTGSFDVTDSNVTISINFSDPPAAPAASGSSATYAMATPSFVRA